MRLSIIRRLQQLSVAFHDKTAAGVIQSKVLRDVESIRNESLFTGNYFYYISVCHDAAEGSGNFAALSCVCSVGLGDYAGIPPPYGFDKQYVTA